jgi:hypothetical protein
MHATSTGIYGSSQFYKGAVISPAVDMAAVQAPGGDLVSADRLGPGIVEQLDPEGRVCVHWVGADFDTCLEPHDVRPLGPHAHLITVKRRDKNGNCKMSKHLVVTRAGLDHNWCAELLPKNVLRVVRTDDNSAWTFGYNTIFKRVDVWWPQPPEDDDAEALTVAELAGRELR